MTRRQAPRACSKVAACCSGAAITAVACFLRASPGVQLRRRFTKHRLVQSGRGRLRSSSPAPVCSKRAAPPGCASARGGSRSEPGSSAGGRRQVQQLFTRAVCAVKPRAAPRRPRHTCRGAAILANWLEKHRCCSRSSAAHFVVDMSTRLWLRRATRTSPRREAVVATVLGVGATRLAGWVPARRRCCGWRS